ncbi:MULTISPECIES: hypothetical protein [Cysteiniphilum]|uniref:Uncharacterized protein n=1 Tax=Cysteiniphilum litorale TaxID=2056700 RepID=A0A8J3EAA1_9GAMM|nr:MULTISPECIES: hypothetical protein [Cysteiniphilum]GGG08751.1 hypothetical protein GCM10010995_27870 [Cysteiniphilum litorale]
MNDNQKERLLKIAENNPVLAREMMEFLKEDSSHREPIAVKMVKSEEDKIEITAEQKKYAIGYVTSVFVAVLSGFIFILSTIVLEDDTANYIMRNFFGAFFVFTLLCVFSSWFCAYKAGMPTIKNFMNKHFKFNSM